MGVLNADALNLGVLTLPSRTFQKTRSDHASEVAEDYVEAIAKTIEANGICRAMDLVSHFDVTHATVSNTIGRLQRDGLVLTEPYQPISLTTKGKRVATKARQRHEIVKAFLTRIGVGEHAASVDSEGMEHHASDETLKAMKRVLSDGLPPLNS